jgi:hypothetical protein
VAGCKQIPAQNSNTANTVVTGSSIGENCLQIFRTLLAGTVKTQKDLLPWVKDLIESIKNQGIPMFENPEFYSYFSGRESLALKIADHWDWDMLSMVKEEGVKNFADLVKKRLGLKYVPLILDPGIASRLHRFLGFSKDYLAKHPDSTAWDLREAFKAALEIDKPRKVLYRGLSLTESELQNILKNGMLAHNLRNLDEVAEKNVIHDQFSETLVLRMEKTPWGAMAEVSSPAGQGPLMELRDHILHGGQSNFLSLSAHTEVSASVASMGLTPEKKIYMFEIDLPEISVIRDDDQHYMLYSITGFEVDKKVYTIKDDVEVFAANVIGPSAIMKWYPWTKSVGKFETVK